MKTKNVNYPVPDPDWDYFGTWQHLQESKSQIDELLFQLAETENATESSDQLITEQLTKILHHLQRACDFMPPRKN
jgi:Na+-translocating ferredoxin:NAD+ oxidoreductase RnfC subunit